MCVYIHTYIHIQHQKTAQLAGTLLREKKHFVQCREDAPHVLDICICMIYIYIYTHTHTHTHTHIPTYIYITAPPQHCASGLAVLSFASRLGLFCL